MNKEYVHFCGCLPARLRDVESTYYIMLPLRYLCARRDVESTYYIMLPLRYLCARHGTITADKPSVTVNYVEVVLRIRGFQFPFLTRSPYVIYKVFRVFPQYVQACAGMRHISRQEFPSTYLQIH
jgi:hypothetical protein